MTNLTEKEITDFRPADISLLEKHGIENEWKTAWEESLCNASEVNKVSLKQMAWHLSRLSFLEGYLLAKAEAA